jgi:hypothetical protein
LQSTHVRGLLGLLCISIPHSHLQEPGVLGRRGCQLQPAHNPLALLAGSFMFSILCTHHKPCTGRCSQFVKQQLTMYRIATSKLAYNIAVQPHLQEPGVLGRRGCLHSTGTKAPAFATASYSDEPFESSTARPLTVRCSCSSLAGTAAAAFAWLWEPGMDVDTRRPEQLQQVPTSR